MTYYQYFCLKNSLIRDLKKCQKIPTDKNHKLPKNTKKCQEQTKIEKIIQQNNNFFYWIYFQ